MKKSILFLSVFLLTGYINKAAVPDREEAEITVNANVLSDLTITMNSSADFGNISSTTAGEVFLDPRGSESSYVGATASAGRFTINGDTNNSVRIGWPPSITLYGDEDDITMTFAVSGGGSDNQASSLDLVADGGFVTVDIGFGAYYIWIGGSLGKMDSQAAGSYTGTAHFTVEYN